MTRHFVPHTPSTDIAIEKTEVTPASIVYSLAAAGSIVALTDFLCWGLDLPSWRYAIMPVIPVGIAPGCPPIRLWLPGAVGFGAALAVTFFAAFSA